jgi:hypothetical protein
MRHWSRVFTVTRGISARCLERWVGYIETVERKLSRWPTILHYEHKGIWIHLWVIQGAGSIISPRCLVWSNLRQLNRTLDLSSNSNTINWSFYLNFVCFRWALNWKITPEIETSTQKPENCRISVFSPLSCLDFNHLVRLSIYTVCYHLGKWLNC